jgi:WD40 repeat protein
MLPGPILSLRFPRLSSARQRGNVRALYASFFYLGLFGPLAASEILEPKLSIQTAHTTNIRSVAFSPDGKLLLTAAGQVAKLWDAQAGTEIREFKGHRSNISQAVFLGHTGRLATAGEDASVKIWDAGNGAQLMEASGTFAFRHLAASQNGELLTAIENELVRTWNTSDGSVVSAFGLINPSPIDYLGSTTMLLHSGYEQPLSAIDVSRKALRAQIALTHGPVRSVGTDFAGRLVSASTDTGTFVFDLKTGQDIGPFLDEPERELLSTDRYLLDLFAAPGPRPTSALSPDGRYLAEFRGKALRLWAVERPYAALATREFAGDQIAKGGDEDSHEIPRLAFSPDSQVVAVPVGSAVKMFSIPDLMPIRSFEGSVQAIRQVAADASGRYLGVLDAHDRLILWDLQVGGIALQRESVAAIALDPQKLALFLSLRKGGLQAIDLVTLRTTDLPLTAEVRAAQISVTSDHTRAMIVDTEGRARLISLNDGKDSWVRDQAKSAAISPDGLRLVVGTSQRTIYVYSGAPLSELMQLSSDPVITEGEDVIGVHFSPDGASVLAIGDHAAAVWDLTTKAETRYFRPQGRARQTGHAQDYLILTTAGYFLTEDRLLIASSDGSAHVWRRGEQRAQQVFEGHVSTISAVTAAASRNIIITGSHDGTVVLWSSVTGQRLLTLVATSDGRWLLAELSGRYDARSLEDRPSLFWLMPDDPLTPLPPEIFMRDYFEPRLLPRLLACREAEAKQPDACAKEFKPIRPMASLNRAQPEVKIVSVDAETSTPDEVTVTVEVRGVEQSFGMAGQAKTWQSGVYDLHLFREGQLVGQAPDARGPEPIEALAPEADLARWRASHRLVEGVGTKRYTFRHVRLPRRDRGSAIEFSAYAFNADRVKSVTALTSYTVPQSLPAPERRAYVIAVGVSAYEDRAWDLSYADDDARRVLQVLTPRLEATGRYKEVIPVLLLADWEERDRVRTVTAATATKRNVQAVLDILAGRGVSQEVRRALPNGTNLQRAGPDDLVLIAYSSHGYADQAGNFYLFPYDIGNGTGKVVNTELLKRAISSAELSIWLRNLDAGELIFVVDACHSAASVESPEFKPGPMGARGLGQLAYDKGMRILASTRADDVAWESARTRQGLLSYALVHDGLEQGKADFRPADGSIGIQEWLEYAVQRVPQLYAEALGPVRGPRPRTLTGAKSTKRSAQGKTTGNGRLVIFDHTIRSARYITRPGATTATQQPSLFNYKRGDDSLLAVR